MNAAMRGVICKPTLCMLRETDKYTFLHIFAFVHIFVSLCGVRYPSVPATKNVCFAHIMLLDFRVQLFLQ